MIIMWDVSELDSYTRNVLKNIQILLEHKDLLENINNRVQEAWQGAAGQSFDEVLEFDRQNFDMVLDGIHALNEDVIAVRNGYQECENDIMTEIQNLETKV